jgi:hypothetical protein
MKHLLKLNLLVFLLLYCKESNLQIIKEKVKEDKSQKKEGIQNDLIKAKDSLNMQGAYLLRKQVVKHDNIDSVLKIDQFKIYTDRHVFYVSPETENSSADFAIGTYTVQNGKLVEYIFYIGSKADHKDTFELKVHKNINGHTQIFEKATDKGKLEFTADYERVGKSDLITPLDGIWRQIKNTYIPKSGNENTNTGSIQYKGYQSGYFVFASSSPGFGKKPVIRFGYGSFEMNGKDQEMEVNINTNMSVASIGKPLALQLEFFGNDRYQQTLVFSNGDRVIEVYERLK